MAVTEQTRHNVHKHFEGSMGEELAATVMEMLPGVGWADVARRRDLDDLRVATTQDIERLRVETRTDLERLRVDLEHLRAETKADLGRFRAEFNGEFRHLREWSETKFDAVDKRFDGVNERFESVVTHADLRKNSFALIAANAAVVTIAVTLARVI